MTQIETNAWGFVTAILGLTLVYVFGTALETWAKAAFSPTQGLGVNIFFMVLAPIIFLIGFGLAAAAATILFGRPFEDYDEESGEWNGDKNV